MRYVFFLCVVLSTVALAEEAESVSICTLAENPARYNHKVVEVQGIVRLEFEGQHLTDNRCPKVDYSIWIVFGGDVSDPEISCCGSHDREPGQTIKVEGIPIPMEKDQTFQRLLADAKAYRIRQDFKEDSRARYPGPFYTVTATIVGGFFSGKPWHRGDGKVFYQGYGHMGCCSLLAIQKVLSIDSVVSNGRRGELKCLNESWRAPEDEPTLAHQQRSIVSAGETWRMTNPERVATESITDLRRLWNDESTGSLAGSCKQDHFEGPDNKLVTQSAQCAWKSDDGLTKYSITLFKNGVLTKQYKSHEYLAWLPSWAERSACSVVS